MKPYELIVNQILDRLDDWILPWQKSWVWWLPCNYETNKEYRWFNKLILLFDDYKDKRYLTPKQIQKLGWTIKKWSKATKVIFYKFSNDWEHPVNEEIKDRENIKYSFPIIRYYNVFNIEQVEWIHITPKKQWDIWERYKKAHSILEIYKDKPNITTGINPCYIPLTDTIQIPKKEKFNTWDNYYSTLFHELIHSTWVPKRLGRFWEKATYYWNTEYSFEELVAEIGAMFLSQEVWIIQSTKNNSIAYIKWWLEYLNSNKRCIIQASSLAQKAVDYIITDWWKSS